MGRHRLRPTLRHVIRQPNRIIAGEAFTGAYDDIPNLAAIYAFRRARSDYDGYLIRLRRSSDNDELDIGYLANGDLDKPTAADFIGAGSGFLARWYEQMNGLHATRSTAAGQPLYVASGQNGKPVARFDGVDDRLVRTSVAISQPLTLFSVAKYADADAENRQLWGNVNPQPTVYTASGNWHLYAGSVVNTLITDDANWHIFSAIFNGASSALHIDGGASATHNPGTAGINSISIGGGVGANFWQGDIAELAIANAAWSTANREAAESAAADYFGITL